MKSNRNKTQFSNFLPGCILLLVFLLTMVDSHAQKDTSYNNTVRFNITNPLIFGSQSLIFGYERMIRDYQSFSINLGAASFPALVYDGGDTILLLNRTDYKDRGFHISGDYRFYLRSENKYPAPRGIYIGPYYSYNFFKRTNNWSLNTDNYQGDIQTDIILNIHTFGAQLGYQFVFWKRLSVDFLLMGPGIGFYGLNTRIGTDLSQEDEQLFFDALNDYLSTKIPGYDRVIEAGEFRKTGSIKTTTVGFRYMVLVGFRF